MSMDRDVEKYLVEYPVQVLRVDLEKKGIPTEVVLTRSDANRIHHFKTPFLVKSKVADRRENANHLFRKLRKKIRNKLKFDEPKSDIFVLLAVLLTKGKPKKHSNLIVEIFRLCPGSFQRASNHDFFKGIPSYDLYKGKERVRLVIDSKKNEAFFSESQNDLSKASSTRTLDDSSKD